MEETITITITIPASHKQTTQQLEKQIEKLEDIILSVTHHPGAVEEFRDVWLPITRDILKNREELYNG